MQVLKARILKGFRSFNCTPRVHLLTEWTIPAVAFPAEAGTHLPTPEGWKAELDSEVLLQKPHCIMIQITTTMSQLQKKTGQTVFNHFYSKNTKGK